MKTKKKLTVLSTVALLAATTAPSSALIVVLSDLVPADPSGNIESFLMSNFTNVTEIRHGNYANFSSTASQDALNGTGAFAGMGAADVFMIGRSLSSGDYDAGDADGYNALTIPIVSLTSYTVRNTGDRMGWHGSGALQGPLVAGAESDVTAIGSSILGLPLGANDLLFNGTPGDPNADTFNGMSEGTTAYGGGQILATVGVDTLAVYWAPGSAPGDPTSADVATFPAARLLFNTDNDPNAGNNGANDLANMTPEGLAALVSAIDFATPLTAVPEPSTSLLGLAGLGLLLARRRR